MWRMRSQRVWERIHRDPDRWDLARAYLGLALAEVMVTNKRVEMSE